MGDFCLKTKHLYTMKSNIILCESTQVKNDAYLTLHIYGGLPPSLTCLSGKEVMRLAANLIFAGLIPASDSLVNKVWFWLFRAIISMIAHFWSSGIVWYCAGLENQSLWGRRFKSCLDRLKCSYYLSPLWKKGVCLDWMRQGGVLW